MKVALTVPRPLPVPPPVIIVNRRDYAHGDAWRLTVAEAVELRKELEAALADPRIAQQVQDAWGIVNH